MSKIDTPSVILSRLMLRMNHAGGGEVKEKTVLYYMLEAIAQELHHLGLQLEGAEMLAVEEPEEVLDEKIMEVLGIGDLIEKKPKKPRKKKGEPEEVDFIPELKKV